MSFSMIYEIFYPKRDPLVTENNFRVRKMNWGDKKRNNNGMFECVICCFDKTYYRRCADCHGIVCWGCSLKLSAECPYCRAHVVSIEDTRAAAVEAVTLDLGLDVIYDLRSVLINGSAIDFLYSDNDDDDECGTRENPIVIDL